MASIPMVWRRTGWLRRWKRQPQIVINVTGSSAEMGRQIQQALARATRNGD